MKALIYFDVEDYFSHPDSPSHQLPGQLARIMSAHGLTGCFHIIGDKARFMEQHQQGDVVAAIREHDVSLHFDRGSVHPTTAEEVSELGWNDGVERVLFREKPGFQALERIFGKCSALTQHGGTFAAQIVHAAGLAGKPFFHSPFRLPHRNIVWFCNNLLIGGFQGDFLFDRYYGVDAVFEQTLARLNAYIAERRGQFDYTAFFGAHPLIMLMEQFPCILNFAKGANPPPNEWIAPKLVPGISIERILQNFERMISVLASSPGLQWTTVAGLTDFYGRRPLKVPDTEILTGAESVISNRGPCFTPVLSAAELLVLLAERVVSPATSYAVPRVLGPIENSPPASVPLKEVNIPAMANAVLEAVGALGHLPPVLKLDDQVLTPGWALIHLAYHATDKRVGRPGEQNPDVSAIPGVATAAEQVKRYHQWRVHGPRYHADQIMEHFLRQCWTLKPALTEPDYPRDVVVG